MPTEAMTMSKTNGDADREPAMVRDHRLAAIVVVLLAAVLLAAACATSRQAETAAGSPTTETGLATRVASAQAQVNATQQAAATSAAVVDATAAARNTATASAQSALLTPTPQPAEGTTVSPAATPLATSASPARPVSTPAPTPPAPLYTADFAAWDSGQKGSPYPASLSFDAATQEYRIALTDTTRAYAYQVYAPGTHTFTDFQLDVDVHRVTGPDGGSYGVLFRIQPRAAGDKANADYAFLVHPDDQYFALNLLMANGTGKNVGKGNSTAIKKGNATNHVTVTCRGDDATLAINGETVGTYSTALLKGGTIGVVVSSPPNPSGPVGMSAAFSNLRVLPAPAP